MGRSKSAAWYGVLSGRGVCLVWMVTWIATVGMRTAHSRSFAILYGNVLFLEYVKFFSHQCFQFTAIFGQVIQHLGHRVLHVNEGLVPAVERFLPQELPQAFD